MTAREGPGPLDHLFTPHANAVLRLARDLQRPVVADVLKQDAWEVEDMIALAEQIVMMPGDL